MDIKQELKELGSRLRRERIASELKQTDLAARAALSFHTVAAAERGQPVTTESLARILSALGYEGTLVDLLPEPTVSPLDLRKLKGKERERVR